MSRPTMRREVMDQDDCESHVGAGLEVLGKAARGVLALRSAESLGEKIKEEAGTEDVSIHLTLDGDGLEVRIHGKVVWVSGCCGNPLHALEELEVWCTALLGIYPLGVDEDVRADLLDLYEETMRQALPV